MRHVQQVAAGRTVLAACLAGLLTAGASGCVSRSLEAEDFRPVGSQTAVSSSPPPNVEPTALAPQTMPQTKLPANNSDGAATGSVSDPAKRQQALEEIRAKAAASSGEKTHIGAVPEAASRQLSSEEQSAIAADLENSRKAADSQLSDAEVEARKAAIRRLQQKGQTHYERAIDSIEN